MKKLCHCSKRCFLKDELQNCSNHQTHARSYACACYSRASMSHPSKSNNTGVRGGGGGGGGQLYAAPPAQRTLKLMNPILPL